MKPGQNRIIELQRQLKIARAALATIARQYSSNPHLVEDQALQDMRPLDKKQPLHGLVGHERRAGR